MSRFLFPRPIPVPIDGRKRPRRQESPICEGPSCWWIAALLLLALVLGAQASSRGSASRVEIWTDRTSLEAGERYAVHLLPSESGYIYLYSLDARGMVHLLYPLTPEDGRGEVEAGRSFSIEPLIAGSLPGREQLVAVHTREYRRIKPGRHEFLAPDPTDLKDIHFRITRDRQELEHYAELALTIDGPEWSTTPDRDVDTERPGITVHQHHYDYWCDYCDLWHPSCTLDHCWCDWRVGHYYHGHYHHHHCGWWGPRHWWWSPPVVYVYLEGGSPWDYDSTPWRERDVWRRQRSYSQEWRQLQMLRVKDQAPPPDDWPRKTSPFVDRDLRATLREAQAEQVRPTPAPKVWTTHPESGSVPSTPGSGALGPATPLPNTKAGTAPGLQKRKSPQTPGPQPRVTPRPTGPAGSASGTGTETRAEARARTREADTHPEHENRRLEKRGHEKEALKAGGGRATHGT
jgi:hypothetical protein